MSLKRILLYFRNESTYEGFLKICQNLSVNIFLIVLFFYFQIHFLYSSHLIKFQKYKECSEAGDLGRIVTATAASATVARYSETTKIKAQARFSGTQLRTILVSYLLQGRFET